MAIQKTNDLDHKKIKKNLKNFCFSKTTGGKNQLFIHLYVIIEKQKSLSYSLYTSKFSFSPIFFTNKMFNKIKAKISLNNATPKSN